MGVLVYTSVSLVHRAECIFMIFAKIIAHGRVEIASYSRRNALRRLYSVRYRCWYRYSAMSDFPSAISCDSIIRCTCLQSNS